MSSKELPFGINFIVSYTSPIIAVLYRSIESAYLAKIFEVFVHLLVGHDQYHDLSVHIYMGILRIRMIPRNWSSRWILMAFRTSISFHFMNLMLE